jgi:hypothetical protein
MQMSFKSVTCIQNISKHDCLAKYKDKYREVVHITLQQYSCSSDVMEMTVGVHLFSFLVFKKTHLLSTN